ncbi:imidazole glycerol phosphate synthase subunit HisH [Sutcliffiella horikoshii]|uniref:Imidazole glycerol phosphate synthase subunit HisH n=1 Tax=Sutcliffiella horikoshii TaxID=79883 RepID=A0A5D4TCR9_9BACI|nr:imidazole glycerol phosphate synthase subunit HisH [Sutcliffiella horikoshii]TYS72302.1 imidazole glycerol phosphate synthase subunit HisH [Sutcliffiella horikoshii]
MIGIIDYGMGNLYSVSKALERMEVEYVISNDRDILFEAEGLILPGVGSFRDAMSILQETGLDTFIKEEVSRGKKMLGICLGMQLLFEESEENGVTEGLSLLKGKVERFSGLTEDGASYKVPHMGWNKLEFQQESPLLEGVPEDYVYFVHSYYVKDFADAELLASSTYDVQVPAVVGRGNVFGTQFHPEKSSNVGLAILKNFVNLVKEEER